MTVPATIAYPFPRRKTPTEAGCLPVRGRVGTGAAVMRGLRRLLRNASPDAEPERTTGVLTHDDDFDRRFLVRSRDVALLTWVLDADLRAAFLATEGAAVAFDGTDVLAWYGDHGGRQDAAAVEQLSRSRSRRLAACERLRPRRPRSG